MCTLSFRRSPLSSSSSVIYSLGFLVMSSSFNLANFLLSIVLETPVVGLYFIEFFVHTSSTSLYLIDFVFDYSTICKHAVSSCVTIRSL